MEGEALFSASQQLHFMQEYIRKHVYKLTAGKTRKRGTQELRVLVHAVTTFVVRNPPKTLSSSSLRCSDIHTVLVPGDGGR